VVVSRFGQMPWVMNRYNQMVTRTAKIGMKKSRHIVRIFSNVVIETIVR
jgi:hypothetical protein